MFLYLCFDTQVNNKVIKDHIKISLRSAAGESNASILFHLVEIGNLSEVGNKNFLLKRVPIKFIIIYCLLSD